MEGHARSKNKASMARLNRPNRILLMLGQTEVILERVNISKNDFAEWIDSMW